MSKTQAATKTIGSGSHYRVDRVSASTVLLTRPVSQDVMNTIKVIVGGRTTTPVFKHVAQRVSGKKRKK